MRTYLFFLIFLRGEIMDFDWEKAWIEAEKNHQRRTTRANMKRWADFWDRVANSYLSDVLRNQDYYRGIVDFLLREGQLVEGDRVLDIGCGPGTFTLHFASIAQEVVALDTSAGMLAVLSDEVTRRGLCNIRTVLEDWTSFDDDQYDLVFSSLSPAIHNPKTLLRMEELSRRSCVLITYSGPHHNSFDREMWGAILEGYRTSGAFDAMYPFNVLYQRGRNPNLRQFPYEFTVERPASEQLDQMISYCSIFTEMDEDRVYRLRKLIDRYSMNGTFRNTTSGSLAVVYWRVAEG